MNEYIAIDFEVEKMNKEKIQITSNDLNCSIEELQKELDLEKLDSLSDEIRLFVDEKLFNRVEECIQEHNTLYINNIKYNVICKNWGIYGFELNLEKEKI